jgi:predicted nucleotidyltransferase
MNLDKFENSLRAMDSDVEILDFCRKHILHGTPYVFENSDEEFYDFRKLIGEKFSVPFYEIYITGSAKLGFSPFKRKDFDLDSDIDVALVSPKLFEDIMSDIAEFQMQFRKNRRVVRVEDVSRIS